MALSVKTFFKNWKRLQIMSTDFVADHWVLFLTGLVVVLLVVIPIAHFAYETVLYRNYLIRPCPTNDFCWIKKIKLAIPDKYIGDLLELAKTEGKRLNIPSKRQKAISLPRLQSKLPEIVDWYKGLPPTVSKELGSPVVITPLSQPNSLCLVVYEQEGDYIDWHFDTNNYTGRYFTLLLPITHAPTSGHYEYRAADTSIQPVILAPGEALIFEGDHVFHRATGISAGEYRVLLSCTFCTTQEFDWTKIIFQRIKNFGVFGE